VKITKMMVNLGMIRTCVFCVDCSYVESQEGQSCFPWFSII